MVKPICTLEMTSFWGFLKVLVNRCQWSLCLKYLGGTEVAEEEIKLKPVIALLCGYSTRILSETEGDDTSYDQCIVPTDLNLFVDDGFRKLGNKAPRGCSVIIVVDSCNSGGLIKAIKEQIRHNTKKASLHSYSFNYNSLQWSYGILLSACQSDQMAAETNLAARDPNTIYGAFTDAIHSIVNNKTVDEITNQELFCKLGRSSCCKLKFPKGPSSKFQLLYEFFFRGFFGSVDGSRKELVTSEEIQISRHNALIIASIVVLSLGRDVRFMAAEVDEQHVVGRVRGNHVE
ncbi:hypothetical protein RJT34_22126 [Clitoria ternatea]|uniref:Uncharacterized protein n=1 Tax=Clitoria ternatea TaxID=43366 RepID=A0AAN9P6T8_CLITE